MYFVQSFNTFLMAMQGVRFQVYHREGDLLCDADKFHMVYSGRTLRKAEIVAKLTLDGKLDEPMHQYEGMILPIFNDDDEELPMTSFLWMSTEEAYRRFLSLYELANCPPVFGLVFKKSPEKG